MSERQGIEIDYCPNCRGVWLDRGEIDKIVERSSGYCRSEYNQNDSNAGRRNDRRDDDEEGGFLENIFGGFGGRGDD